MNVALTLPPDGRQSLPAMAIRRGVRRMLLHSGAVTLPELTLADGRRADLVALSPDGSVTIVEIKSCRADFRADRKWQAYRAYCDHFYFAVDEAFPLGLLPEEAGLIVADAFGAERLREPATHPLASARRKAVLLRFARQAAAHLHRLEDPEAARGDL